MMCLVIVVCARVEWGKVFEGGGPESRAASQSTTGNFSQVNNGRVSEEACQVQGNCEQLEAVRRAAVCQGGVREEGGWGGGKGQVMACSEVGISS